MASGATFRITSTSEPAVNPLTYVDFFHIMKEMGKGQPLSERELLILLALIRLEPEAYGVPIAREIEARTGRMVALSGVYTALERLESRGLVKSNLGEASSVRGGRARRYFQVTAQGVRELRAMRRALTAMWTGIPALEGGKA
jgi:DNA-binding PadR family transcriptional regulator